MFQNLNDALKLTSWNKTLTCDIESSSNSFVSKLKEIISSFTRKGSHKPQKGNLPWLDQTCRSLLKTRDLLLKKYLKSRLSTDRQRFTQARNKVTQALRKAKAKFFINIIESTKGNGKKTWQILNKLLGKNVKSETAPLEIEINNELICDPLVLTNAFNNYFVDSITEITKLFPASSYLPQSLNTVNPIFELQNIKETEVAKIISTLKKSKARDVNGIDTNFLRTYADCTGTGTTYYSPSQLIYQSKNSSVCVERGQHNPCF